MAFKVLFLLLFKFTSRVRNNIPVDPIWSLKYWINFNLILGYSIPLTLFVIKLRLTFGNMRSLKLSLILNYVILTGN